MSIVTYLFPLLILGGLAFYYLRIYGKGKAAGGGLMEGFSIAAHEKWTSVLAPGEKISVFGAGMLARPAWQTLLASQIPLLRLVWPTVSYQLCVTDQGRLLIGKYNMLGQLPDQASHPRDVVQFAGVEEEKPGLALKLNPLYRAFGQDIKTYSLKLHLSGNALPLGGVTGTVVDAFRS
jgi:hypothetical protein